MSMQKKDKELYTQIWKAYQPFATSTRLIESLHEFDTKKNEAMNASITKYTPKTKTYRMTISLTNRLMIAIGIDNYGTEKYLRRVYNKLDIAMAPETVSFLQSQDKSRFYRKIKRKDTSKKRRVTTNNNKIKRLMEKQRIDEKQGKTYGSGVALESDSIPEFVKEAEEEKKELLGIQCPFYGCFVKGHKTTKGKMPVSRCKKKRRTECKNQCLPLKTLSRTIR